MLKNSMCKLKSHGGSSEQLSPANSGRILLMLGLPDSILLWDLRVQTSGKASKGPAEGTWER
jgi:hypothetical protein